MIFSSCGSVLFMLHNLLSGEKKKKR